MFMVVLILVHASYSEYKEEVNDHSSEGCPRFLRNNTVWISREKKKCISRRTIEFSEFATTPDFERRQEKAAGAKSRAEK